MTIIRFTFYCYKSRVSDSQCDLHFKNKITITRPFSPRREDPRCITMLHDTRSRSGRSKGEGWPGWKFRCISVTSDKAFLCPFRPFDFEISREFWANPHITVIYVEPAFRRGGRRSSRPGKGRILLNFKFIRAVLS